jgi:hypothetical protein
VIQKKQEKRRKELLMVLRTMSLPRSPFSPVGSWYESSATVNVGD